MKRDRVRGLSNIHAVTALGDDLWPHSEDDLPVGANIITLLPTAEIIVFSLIIVIS